MFGLLAEEDFNELPTQRSAAFLLLLRTLEARYRDRAEVADKTNELSLLREDYVEQVVAVANALGIEGLAVPSNVGLPSGFNDFVITLGGLKTRLSLEQRLKTDSSTVALIPSTKARIEFEIEKLRSFVDDSDLTDAKKKALRKKLDELTEELSKERVSLSTFLKVAASIATILGGSSTFLVNAPEAARNVLTLVELIGDEKVQEDERPKALEPPRRALPAPSDPQEET